MSELLKRVDARTKLAGTNKLEMLLFTLGAERGTGKREVFGVNVFKVREVMRAPAITRAPDMPPSVEGMVSLRGRLVPVIDLGKYAGIRKGAYIDGEFGSGKPQEARPPEILIVTEFNGQTQGLLVEAVETIFRVDWSAMRVPPQLIARKAAGLVNAVTELPDGRLAMMLDVEQLLAERAPVADNALYSQLASRLPRGRTVLFADDSAVARAQITRTLEALHVNHIATANGVEAWRELSRVADNAKAQGREVRQNVQVVLTDVEMPEMDGYMLAKRIRSDARFKGVQIIMHSSLSGSSNQQLGQSVGVDEYVSKFEPAKLAAALSRRLA